MVITGDTRIALDAFLLKEGKKFGLGPLDYSDLEFHF
jgi:hypothetical protein